MIQLVSQSEGDALGYRAVGDVTKSDYRDLTLRRRKGPSPL